MKKAFLVYYDDKTANVVICQDLFEIPQKVGFTKYSKVVKIDLIPFEIL